MLNKFKAFFVSLLFILCVVAPAANATVITGVPTLTIGARVFTDLTNLITLKCYMSGTSTNSTCRKENSSTGYTPSGTKKFHAYAAKLISLSGASLQSEARICQSDNDVGFSSSTAFTNQVNTAGSAASDIITPIGNGQSAYEALDFSVANTKYVCAYSPSSSMSEVMYVYGYEE